MNSNIRQLIMSLTIAIIGFTTTITISPSTHAKDTNTYWNNKVNSYQQQLHAVGDKVLITNNKGKNIYLTKTDKGNLLILNDSTNNMQEECTEAIKDFVDTPIAMLAIAFLTAGAGLVIMGYAVEATAIAIIGSGIPNSRDQLIRVLSKVICHKDPTTNKQ